MECAVEEPMDIGNASLAAYGQQLKVLEMSNNKENLNVIPYATDVTELDNGINELFCHQRTSLDERSKVKKGIVNTDSEASTTEPDVNWQATEEIIPVQHQAAENISSANRGNKRALNAELKKETAAVDNGDTFNAEPEKNVTTLEKNSHTTREHLSPTTTDVDVKTTEKLVCHIQEPEKASLPKHDENNYKPDGDCKIEKSAEENSGNVNWLNETNYTSPLVQENLYTVEEGIKDTEPIARTSIDPSPDLSTTENSHLDMINQKRQEEREAFQKLIDECTTLQAELNKVKAAKEYLETRQDIMAVELDSEKDKCADQKELINSLEQQLAVGKSAKDHVDVAASPIKLNKTLQRQDDLVIAEQSDYEANMKDMQLKIKHMAQGDLAKSNRIVELEARLSEFESLMTKLEHEFGTDRIENVQSGITKPGGTEVNAKYAAPNTINPALPRSSVCAIM